MCARPRPWMLALLLVIADLAAAGDPVDFGDAPDDDLVCQAGGTVFPANYPTQSTTVNAAPGRTAPFHAAPADPDAFVALGSQAPVVTYEAEALEAVSCDWVTGPPCDHDNGVLLLCFGAVGCPSGVVFFATDPDCGRWGAGVFGPVPPLPAPLGRYYFEVSRGPTSVAAAFVNVTADFELDASWGGSGEWILVDRPIPILPWQTQLLITAPFPVPTVVAPCPNAPLNWCVLPFWTRFMVSPEAVAAAFPGGDWDGSGAAGGYGVGETEDVVPAGDPGIVPLDPLPNDCHESTATLRLTLDPADPFCALAGIDVSLGSTSVAPTEVRRFAPPAFVTGTDVATEIVALELVGGHPTTGPMLVGVQPDPLSLGKLDAVVADGAGGLLSAESFFDLVARIEFAPDDVVVTTDAAALRLDAGAIGAFPALDHAYAYPLGGRPLALEDAVTGLPRGWLCSGTLSPTTTIPCGQVIHRDGFETGDDRRWSATVAALSSP